MDASALGIGGRRIARSSRLAASVARVLVAVVGLLVFHYLLNDYLFHRKIWPVVHPILGLSAAVLAENPWIDLFAGHAWALALTLLALRLLGGSGWLRWSGLTVTSIRESLRLSWPVCLAWIDLISAFFGLLYVLPGNAPTFAYPLTALNVGGWLAFEWLFAGTIEEIKYRGLYQSVVGRYWTGAVRLGGIELPIGGLVAAALFGLAHVQFSYSPFGVASANVPQIAIWLVLAVWFSVVRRRTGSLVGPVLVHNFCNGFAQSLLFGLAYLLA
jgi:hypothetical protein